MARTGYRSRSPGVPRLRGLRQPDTSKVTGPKKLVQGSTASFAFSSTAAGATFECRLDKGAFRTCSSPFKVVGKK